jgi:hypothetical protein
MKKFTVKEEHIKLLQHMWVWFDDNAYMGAPAVDIKRPYGNSSVLEDIGEIIGEKPAAMDGDYPIYSDKQQDSFKALHEEMGDVLQILVRNLGIKPGVYECDDYDVNWRPVRNKR